MNPITQNLEVWSNTFGTGFVELTLEDSFIPKPIDDEVVIEVHAAPINPLDLRLMIGPAEPATAVAVGTRERPVTHLRIPDAPGGTVRDSSQFPHRLGAEGFGRVVDAGNAPQAKALLGQSVAVWSGGMYSRYCKVRTSDCLPLPASTQAAEGAGALINPLTALAMVETMRAEGYTALLNSAAGSNLGRILRGLCSAERIELINVVRSEVQAQAIKSEGARHVCVSTAPGFVEELTACLRAAGPTLGFDAIGGGVLAGTLIAAMDAAKAHDALDAGKGERPSKVYIYGSLDPSPSMITRGYSPGWSIAGWAVTAVLKMLGAARVGKLKRRIVRDLTTTFAAQYARTVSLSELIAPQTLVACARRSTGAKYLVDPRLDRKPLLIDRTCDGSVA
jgi:NADPH:quinone reductase-like Zn-dependent oxidoreductase